MHAASPAWDVVASMQPTQMQQQQTGAGRFHPVSRWQRPGLAVSVYLVPRRSAAWWLGENANFGAGEYAWAPRPLTPELVQQLEAADGCSQAQMAAAAVAMNPVLSVLIARLQRVMVTGLWEVRVAAAQVRVFGL